MAVGFDGKLWVSGGFDNGYLPLEFRNLVRLLDSGGRDDAFVLVEPFANSGRVVLPQRDGKVLVAGSTGFPPDVPPSDTIARFGADGTRASGPLIEGFSYRDAISAAQYTADGGMVLAGNLEFGDFLSSGLVFLEPIPEPMIARQPAAPLPTRAGGAGLQISVDALANGTATYQWQMQYAGDAGSGAEGTVNRALAASSVFVDVPGATSATLSIPVPQRFHNGLYRVVITANGLSVTSDAVAVGVAPAITSPDARLANLSTRALVQTGDNVLIPGFVIAGTQTKQLLIRAVGPTLDDPPISFGGGTLPDPRMTLKRHNFTTNADEVVAANDNWSTNANAAEIATRASDLGAFALTQDHDAALLLDLAPGQYTVIADDAANQTGIAIVELYDGDPDGTGSRLVNISNRGFVGTGANVMIPGFVVSHEGPKTFLIRAVGPRLAAEPYNVTDTMADPKLVVYKKDLSNDSDHEILSQDNWSDNPEAAYTAQTAEQVSAFSLADGSKDAAFVVTLPPGVYTVIGSSADGVGTGVVLVEVYVVE